MGKKQDETLVFVTLIRDEPEGRTVLRTWLNDWHKFKVGSIVELKEEPGVKWIVQKIHPGTETYEKIESIRNIKLPSTTPPKKKA